MVSFPFFTGRNACTPFISQVRNLCSNITIMFTTHLKLAFRHLRKQRGFSFINIAGLAIGIATCLLMLLYISHELSYDRFHEKADRIVRVVTKGNFQGEPLKEPMAMPPTAADLAANFPEIEETTRLRDWGEQTIIAANQTFHAQSAAFVDPTFFSVFSFPLIHGNATTALAEANSVVLSATTANRYFGNADVIGKTIRLKNNQEDYLVTGVMADMPANSSLQKEILLSMTGLEEARSNSYLQSEFYTFLVLPKGYNYQNLQAKLPMVFERLVGPQIQKAMGVSLADFAQQGNSIGLFLQPLTDIYLHSDFVFDIAAHGDIRYVWIFSAIALFMLIIAGINFMNLSTAGASKRMKEVGVRKVLGSNQRQLVNQFLTESLLLSFLSLGLGVLLVQMALPFFNELMDRELNFGWLENSWLIPALLLFGGLIGLLAGAYPALFLARFKTKTALHQVANGTQKNSGLRSGLVVFQFALTIIFLIGTAVVYQQMQYIQNAKLGYDTDSVLIIDNLWRLHENEVAFKQRIKQDPRILRTSYSNFVPVSGVNNNFFIGTPANPNQMLKTLRYYVDEDYLNTLSMQMAAGQFFIKEQNNSQTVIINEATAQAMNWSNDEAIGKTLRHQNNHNGAQELQVIGVVKNFHFKSLRERIAPLVMTYAKDKGAAAVIKLKTDNINNVLSDLQTHWQQLSPDEPFSSSFLDANYAMTYQNERKAGVLLSLFAGLTIFIACLGLFGLTIFMIERRTKEIGIRKVLGASVTGIVQLLARDFLKLVLFAFVLACPIAWYASNRWLEDFAYRIEPDWRIFLLVGGVAILIAFATVSLRSVRAALVNPAQVLKDE